MKLMSRVEAELVPPSASVARKDTVLVPDGSFSVLSYVTERSAVW